MLKKEWPTQLQPRDFHSQAQTRTKHEHAVFTLQLIQPPPLVPQFCHTGSISQTYLIMHIHDTGHYSINNLAPIGATKDTNFVPYTVLYQLAYFDI